jgi:hypothetical protein
VEGGVHQPARPLSFFDLKGDVETCWRRLLPGPYYDANTADYYHPG